MLKKTKAFRTWPMIKEHGVIEAVNRVVKRSQETVGYTVLLDMGLDDYSFEAVVVKHPDSFSEDAVKKSQMRISQWKNTE